MDEAAVALEECDRKYKAVLARPRDNSKHDDTLYDRYDQDYYSGPASASVKSRRGPPPRDIRGILMLMLFELNYLCKRLF